MTTRLEELSQQVASLEHQLRNARDQVHEEIRRILLLSSDQLTVREEEVLSLVRKRLCNKEIATRLNLSVRTVKFHVQALFRKFAVQTRYDL